MSNKELLEFLVSTIRKYPNNQDLGREIRDKVHHFLSELEKENREIDRLTDEEIAVLSSLRNIR